MRHLFLAVVVAGAGCGGKAVIDPPSSGGNDGSGGATTAGGATATTGVGAGGEAPAPLQTECPGGEQQGCQTELLAVTVSDDWGPTAAFVAADGNYVVGNREAASSPAFLVRTEVLAPDEAVAEEVPLPPSPFAAVDVIDRGEVVEVLACDGATCLITRVSAEGMETQGVPDGSRGMVPLLGGRCVFGEGVHCGGAAIDDLAPVVSGGTWLAGDADGGTAWFVGEGGTMGRWDGATWLDTGLSGPTLRAVTAEGGTEAIAAGDDGAVVIVNDGGARALCSVGDDWVGVTRRYGGPGDDDFALLSATTWRTKVPSGNAWCIYGVMTPTPLALDHDTCNGATRWRLLFADRVFAGQDCGP